MADTCPRCSAPTVSIGLFDGDARLTMRSCSNCDHRTWHRDGKPASKGEVLGAVGAGTRRKTA